MLIHHATHHVVEVRIAAVDNGPAQIVLGVGPVTTDDIAVAHNVRAFRNDALLHADEALHHLEDGSRSVRPPDRPVVKGFPWVFGQTVVRRTPARSRQQISVIGGGRDEGENFTGCGFERDDGAPLSHHEFFRVALQFSVDGQGHIVPGRGQRVQFGQRVAHVVPNIDQMMSKAGSAPQLFFEQGFYARLPLVIAQAIPSVSVHVFPIHFAVLTHDLACDAKHILSDGLGANRQPGIAPQFCRQCGVFGRIELPHQGRRLVTRIPAGTRQTRVEVTSFKVQQVRKRCGVDVGHGSRHDHQIVTRHVVDQQFSMSIEAEPSRRLEDFLLFGQAFCTVLVLICGHLHLEQAQHEQHPHAQDDGPKNALSTSQFVASQFHG